MWGPVQYTLGPGPWPYNLLPSFLTFRYLTMPVYVCPTKILWSPLALTSPAMRQ